ncbi:MAG: c-type cytochrome [Hymenobacteraceae bacterium]|nr:c-type cytochrome [Hymenobacteraceae bacterium]MDX5396536.1 c-type cytochrome [Hymenobacteraceae bacterium]MDX5512600.1 c-type cytochrome [Hymenobacteraceae bacterium]
MRQSFFNRIWQKGLKNGFVIAAIVAAGYSAEAQVVDGAAVFNANCAACHSIESDVVGPALKDVHKRRDEKWIKSFIQNSTELIASGDKQANEVFEKYGKVPMPVFKGSLSDAEIDGVIGYIKAESEKPVEAVVTPVNNTDPAKPATEQAAFDFDLKALPPSVLLLSLLVLFLFSIMLVTMGLVFFQSLPLLAKLYDKPELSNSWVGKLVHLSRGDATVLTGKYKDVLTDHDYDGITEFDNDLPPWWKYMFYVTIVFSFVYMGYYHIFKDGRTMEEEYQAEMQQAALFKASSEDDPNAVTDFTTLTDASALENGKNLYLQNCAACHGNDGEGKVGPNLTDEYWMHGGDVNDIFKTIKFGVTNKGMVAWNGKLSKDQILEVSSYILSLKGSNPANAKEPQGEKYEAKK